MLRRTLLAIATMAGLTLALPANAQSEGNPMPAPTTSGYAPVNGVEVFYASYGEGSPIVLLHGVTSSWKLNGKCTPGRSPP